MNIDRRGFLGRLFGGAVAVAGGAILAKAAQVSKEETPARFHYWDWQRHGDSLLSACTSPLGGTFTIEMGGEETSPIDWNAGQQEINAAIAKVSNKLKRRRRRHG